MSQSRRSFLKNSAGFAALAAFGPYPMTPPSRSSCGIQIGPDCFVDEGIENVLDILQQKGAVDTLYLSTFTYDRGIIGRTPGKNYPGHGVDASDKGYFHGGNYATPHAKFYADTAIKGDKLKAPDFDDRDILAEVLPKAKRRGMKTICSIQDGFSYPADMPFVENMHEIDLQGRKSGALCFFNPDVREFWSAVARDLCSSYDIDGVLLFNERNGPLLNAIGVSHAQTIDSARVTCFCPYHEQAAKARGIDFQRAREGYLQLDRFVQQAFKDQRPSDGYYVEFERLMLTYPEIMAYNQLFDAGKHQVLKDIYTSVKSIRRELQVGFHIEHTNSFNPLYRATRDYAQLAELADFLKVVVYNNCGGERYVNFIHNICRTVFRDVPPGELMQMNNHLLNYANEAPIETLAAAGLSPDYVMRETQRAKAGVKGKCRILPGIDVNIPTGEKSRKASPDDTYQATASAFKGGADGVILSRKYSEMHLDNLAAAGRAVRAVILNS
ncbi:MAG TPA: twin-arginine translocation signal domain-containing protein [Puia sp.]|nr:twin-arginine translocation signal domain-containing protein [Puia sp.]